jgi:hypothetical protein
VRLLRFYASALDPLRWSSLRRLSTQSREIEPHLSNDLLKINTSNKQARPCLAPSRALSGTKTFPSRVLRPRPLLVFSPFQHQDTLVAETNALRDSKILHHCASSALYRRVVPSLSARSDHTPWGSTSICMPTTSHPRPSSNEYFVQHDKNLFLNHLYGIGGRAHETVASPVLHWPVSYR